MTSSLRLVDLVENLPPSRCGEEDRPLLRQFVARVEEVCDERYRSRRGPEALITDLSDTFEFYRRRKRGETLVRVTSTEGEASGDRQRPAVFLEVVARDHPFIVDTVELFLEFAGITVLSSLYFTLPVKRARGGRLTEIGETVTAPTRTP